MNNDNYTAGDVRDRIVGKIKKESNKVMWVGIAFAVLGILALVFPMFTSLTVEIMIGWLFLLFGIVAFFGSFSYEGTGPFFGALLTALLSVAAGVYMLVHPEIGLISLTIIIAILFLIQGTFQMVLAFDIKPAKGWGWVVLSSIASMALGILIAAGMPESSFVMIGILVGVNFLITGISLLLLVRDVKKNMPSTTAS